VLRCSSAWKVLKGMVMVIRLGARFARCCAELFTESGQTIKGLSDGLLYFLFRFAQQGSYQHKSSCIRALILMSRTDKAKPAPPQMAAL
jgi:hypothetical protein